MAPISQKNHPIVKFQITDPPKVRVSAFPSVNINENLASVIMQKMENGHLFVKNHHTATFQITDPQ